MALVSDISVKASLTETVAGDLQTTRAPISYLKRILMASGTGADQADLVFTDTRTLSASATEDLDLRGSLLTPLGQAAVLVKLKGIIVTAAAGNTNNVNVTRPASNGVPLFLAASDGIAVRPGGCFAWFARDATAIGTTAGTVDLITFTNSAGTTPVTYDVILIGTSA